MNTRKLYEIINAIDFKYDIEIRDYFKLSIQDREELAELVAESLIKHSSQIPVVLHSYIAALESIISQNEVDEEFEKCDIFLRIEKKLFDKIDKMV